MDKIILALMTAVLFLSSCVSTGGEAGNYAQKTQQEEADDDFVKQAPIDENYVDTDGIIILSPGESEASELEKYILGRRKQVTEAGDETEKGTGEEITFEYEPDSSGVLLVESESNATVDRAGFVLVEKAGFISQNFTEDGFVYSLDEHKELIAAGDMVYIKLTATTGAPKGRQFSIYEDSEEVVNKLTGEPMGKLIKFVGVLKIIGNVEDNIYRAKITKSYEPIRNNYKIKTRQDMQKYHKEISMKVKKKNLAVRANIVKVKDDTKSLKSTDLIYLDAGISSGLLPGEKLGIYRPRQIKETGKEEEYNRIGTCLIMNSMQNSAVALIVKQDDIIRAGDIVKTPLK